MFGAQRDEIRRLCGQIETLQVVMRGKERQWVENEREIEGKMRQGETQAQGRIRELEQQLDSSMKAQSEIQKRLTNL